MKIKHLLALTAIAVIGVLNASAQSTNYISGWNGGSSTGKPTEYGWSSSSTKTSFGDLNGGSCRMMTNYSGYKNGSANYTYDSSDPNTRILLIRYNNSETFTYTFEGLKPGHAYKFTGLICWVNNDNGNGHQYTISVKGTNEYASKMTTIGGTNTDKQIFKSVEIPFIVPVDETATKFTLNFKCNRNGDNIESITNLKIVCDDTKYSADALANLKSTANSLVSTLEDGDVKTNLQTAIDNVDDTNIDVSLYNLNKALNAANRAKAMVVGTAEVPTDWTGVIANPSFEDYELTLKKTSGGNQNSPAGWKQGKIWEDGAWNYSVKSTDYKTEGSSSFKVRFNWASDSYSISQKIADLPMGKYKLTADVINYNANGSACKAKISANNNETELTEITEAKTLEKEFVLGTDGDVTITLTSDYLYKSGSCEGILYWDNVKLYSYGITDEVKLVAAKNELRNAIDNKKVPTANISESSDNFVQWVKDSVDEIEGYKQQGEDLIANSTDIEAIEEITNKIKSISYTTVMSQFDKPMNIIMAKEGLGWSGNAVTFTYSEGNQNNYAMAYSEKPGESNFNQTVYFDYNGDALLYIVDAEGKKWYLTDGNKVGSTVAWAGSQLRMTDVAEDAMPLDINPSYDKEGECEIINVWTGEHIGSTNNNGFYCSNDNYELSIKDAATKEIEIKVAKYGTVILPADVDNVFISAKFYSVNSLDGNMLVLTEEGDVLKANTPYIVENQNSLDDTSISIGCRANAFKTSYTNGLLTGVFADTKAPTGSYVLQNQDGNVAFYEVSEEDPITVPAGKAYLTAPTSGAKAISFPSATAINAIEALTSGSAKIYDVNGREINKLQKGINIVNGVKVLVK